MGQCNRVPIGSLPVKFGRNRSKMGQCNRVPIGSLPVKFGRNRSNFFEKYNNGKNNSLHHGNGEA